MLRANKPRNARSKRAAEKREAKEYEDAKTAIFVHGPHSSDKVNIALRDLAALKKPDVISFTKKNDVIPFQDASSLEFWAGKNDASLFVVGNSQKKRKDNLTWVRTFDGQVLDMLETGITDAKAITSFKSKLTPSIGARPLFHFSGPHFSPETAASDANALHSGALSMCNQGLHASFQHLKSLLLDFYRGEELPAGSGPGSIPGQAGSQISLREGLQHVISVTEAPHEASAEETGKKASTAQEDELAQLYAAGAEIEGNSKEAHLDKTAMGRVVHFRVYALILPGSKSASAVGAAAEASNPSSSGATLEEIGPSFDFVLRRRQPADPTRLAAALKRAKTQAERNRQGRSVARKNVETDDMGDTVGRIHVGTQDLDKLQTRKMKGLKVGREEREAMEDDADEDEDEVYLAEDGDDEEPEMESVDGEGGFDSEDDNAEEEVPEPTPKSKKRRA